MGRKPEDIAFLCYRNSDICDLVTFFNEKKTEFEDRLSGKVAPGAAFQAYLDGLVAAPPKSAIGR